MEASRLPIDYTCRLCSVKSGGIQPLSLKLTGIEI